MDNQIPQHVHTMFQKTSIPHFRHQPDTIAWCIRIARSFDPSTHNQLLILLLNKGISAYYHLLYIEISRCYEEYEMYDVCLYILQRGINKNVHDRDVLEREYMRICELKRSKCSDSEYKYVLLSEHEIYRILYPKKLFLWGKEWIEKKVEYFYEKELVCNDEDGKQISFLEKKTIEYLENKKKVSEGRNTIREDQINNVKTDKMMDRCSKKTTDAEQIINNELEYGGRNTIRENKINNVKTDKMMGSFSKKTIDAEQIINNELEYGGRNTIREDQINNVKTDKMMDRCSKKTTDAEQIINDETEDISNVNDDANKCFQKVKNNQAHETRREAFADHKIYKSTINNGKHIIDTNQNHEIQFLYPVNDPNKINDRKISYLERRDTLCFGDKDQLFDDDNLNKDKEVLNRNSVYYQEEFNPNNIGRKSENTRFAMNEIENMFDETLYEENVDIKNVGFPRESIKWQEHSNNTTQLIKKIDDDVEKEERDSKIGNIKNKEIEILGMQNIVEDNYENKDIEKSIDENEDKGFIEKNHENTGIRKIVNSDLNEERNNNINNSLKYDALNNENLTSNTKNSTNYNTINNSENLTIEKIFTSNTKEYNNTAINDEKLTSNTKNSSNYNNINNSENLTIKKTYTNNTKEYNNTANHNENLTSKTKNNSNYNTINNNENTTIEKIFTKNTKEYNNTAINDEKLTEKTYTSNSKNNNINNSENLTIKKIFTSNTKEYNNTANHNENLTSKTKNNSNYNTINNNENTTIEKIFTKNTKEYNNTAINDEKLTEKTYTSNSKYNNINNSENLTIEKIFTSNTKEYNNTANHNENLTSNTKNSSNYNTINNNENLTIEKIFTKNSKYNATNNNEPLLSNKINTKKSYKIDFDIFSTTNKFNEEPSKKLKLDNKIGQNKENISNKTTNHNTNNESSIIDTNEYMILKNELIIGECATIDKWVYLIKSNITDDIYLIKRIAMEGSDGITIKPKDYCIQKVHSKNTEKICFPINLKSMYPKNIKKGINKKNEIFYIYENVSYVSLKKILMLFIEENGRVDEKLLVFYYLNVYRTILEFRNKNIYIDELSEESFLVDDKNNVVLVNFNIESKDERIIKKCDYDVLERLCDYTCFEMFAYVDEYRNLNWNLVAKIEADLSKINLDKLFLEQKMLCLENS